MAVTFKIKPNKFCVKKSKHKLTDDNKLIGEFIDSDNKKIQYVEDLVTGRIVLDEIVKI